MTWMMMVMMMMMMMILMVNDEQISIRRQAFPLTPHLTLSTSDPLRVYAQPSDLACSTMNYQGQRLPGIVPLIHGPHHQHDHNQNPNFAPQRTKEKKHDSLPVGGDIRKLHRRGRRQRTLDLLARRNQVISLLGEGLQLAHVGDGEPSPTLQGMVPLCRTQHDFG
jgi:hypothetical protein